MPTNPAAAGLTAFLAVSLAVVALGLLLRLRGGDRRRARGRLRELAPADSSSGRLAALARWPLEGLYRVGALATAGTGRTAQIQAQLVQAGYFRPNALVVFMGCRFVLAGVLAVAGVLLPCWAGPATFKVALLGGLVGAGVGAIGPSFWLSGQVRRRQGLLRATLPDALDMLVLCLEGGVGLNGAVGRVTDELQVVHPVLGMEMDLVRREMQLGVSAGDALRKFADRCGLTDVRDLANVLLQSERFGASVAKALRGYADSARLARQQKARETAQKASVQILFPTLLFIFPAIFIVLLGPAAFQMAKLFSR